MCFSSTLPVSAYTAAHELYALLCRQMVDTFTVEGKEVSKTATTGLGVTQLFDTTIMALTAPSK